MSWANRREMARYDAEGGLRAGELRRTGLIFAALTGALGASILLPVLACYLLGDTVPVNDGVEIGAAFLGVMVFIASLYLGAQVFELCKHAPMSSILWDAMPFSGGAGFLACAFGGAVLGFCLFGVSLKLCGDTINGPAQVTTVTVTTDTTTTSNSQG